MSGTIPARGIRYDRTHARRAGQRRRPWWSPREGRRAGSAIGHSAYLADALLALGRVRDGRHVRLVLESARVDQALPVVFIVVFGQSSKRPVLRQLGDSRLRDRETSVVEVEPAEPTRGRGRRVDGHEHHERSEQTDPPRRRHGAPSLRSPPARPFTPPKRRERQTPPARNDARERAEGGAEAQRDEALGRCVHHPLPRSPAPPLARSLRPARSRRAPKRQRLPLEIRV